MSEYAKQHVFVYGDGPDAEILREHVTMLQVTMRALLGQVVVAFFAATLPENINLGGVLYCLGCCVSTTYTGDGDAAGGSRGGSTTSDGAHGADLPVQGFPR